MTANKPVRGPFGALLVAALVGAMVALLVFVPSGEAAPAADDRPTPKIVGGKPVPDGKYPFMAILRIRGPEVEGSCGGSLIDPDSVLTAAHCLADPKTGEPLGKLRVEAYVGRTVRSSNQGQVRSVKTFYIHPNYDPKLTVYDAAVLELRRPVSGIEPIELATSSQSYLERSGREATVAGWGITIAEFDQVPGGPAIPDRLQEAQVPIVSDSRADKAWEDYRIHGKRYLDYVPPLMVAAAEKDKGGCYGDSGGPLFSAPEADGDNDDGDNGDGDNGDDKNRRDTNGGSGGKYTQIGIVSTGSITCGGKEVSPDIYTEVNAPSIRSFITNAASK